MSTEEPHVVWTLEGYSKADEFLRTQFPVSREQLLRLREVITPDPGDPWMLDWYPVPVEVWPAVEAILRCGPPDPGLDYFAGAYAAE
ncbi:hypothetical protein M5362_27745 [Streptomyces sp. Je 1-79]|uniref:DUF7683 domain-containing protein n=1 Tax=Streptomyces sp. Je 1-79 TaxID=2943847 RepID=UPI0021A4BAD6|nr:hypothetical protein [Streptomyces sp. Je 1-79]MCT4356919.1 hypothetical protein [Streptomyces sp. Je 1-79]